MLYFAYGSNLDIEQMKRRCPSAVPVGKALLDDHQLGFKRWSDFWKGGVATIVPMAGQGVWGLLYEINETDLKSLDGSEGFDPMKFRDQNAYIRDERIVFKEGSTNHPLCAWVYLSVPQGDYFKPGPGYMEGMLKSAKKWEFPVEYLSDLEKIG